MKVPRIMTNPIFTMYAPQVVYFIMIINRVARMPCQLCATQPLHPCYIIGGAGQGITKSLYRPDHR